MNQNLSPSRPMVFILVVIILFGLMDWYNVLNPCESPFFGICPDYPSSHHPDVLPGLFPPLLFDEGCFEPHEKRSNIIGWECRPNTWMFMMPAGSYCESNCDVKTASWIYTIVYWCFLSWGFGIIFRYFRRRMSFESREEPLSENDKR